MKKFIFLAAIFFAGILTAGAQITNNTCATSDPFCTGTTYNFPAGVNTGSAQSGPNYGCLYSQPNPVWYYLLIDQPGNISIDIHSNPQRDLDFICWGPFTNQISPCQTASTSLTNAGNTTSHWNSTNPHPSNMGGYPSGNTVDCSYNSSWQEWCYIPNAQSGTYYILLITNYSNQACNIIFNQTNVGLPGAGTTNCYAVYCNITNVVVTPGPCQPLSNTFDVTGTIYYTFQNPPASDFITVTDVNSGVQTTINNPPMNATSPYNSQVNFTLPGILADGAQHTITATFGSASNCTFTITYNAPPPCNQCFANAGPDQTVCGLTATMAAVEDPTDVNTHWLAQSGVTYSDINSPTSNITVTTAGTYTLVWEIQNSNGVVCTDEMTVTFNPIPTSSFTTNSPVCDGTNITATYNGSGGQQFVWDFGSAGTPANAVTQGPHNISYSAPGTYPISLTVVSAQQCTSAVTTQNVIVNPNPPSNFTVQTPICAGDPSNIAIGFATNPSYNYVWSVSPSGTPASLVGPGPHTVTWSNAAVVTVTLTVVNTATNCTSSVTTQNIQVLDPNISPSCCETPTPNAGPDVPSVCGLTYGLQGSLPGPGNTGTWTMVSGPGVANFQNNTLNTSNVTVTQPGTYVFQWYEVSGACNASDQVSINFVAQPVANIPLDRIQICGNTANLTAVPSVTGSTCSWSLVAPNTATYAPGNTSPSVTITGTSGYGYYYFVWTESMSGACASRDTIRVELLETPNVNAGLDTTSCGYTAQLHADPTYPGYWTSSVTSVIYNPGAGVPNPTIQIPNYTQPSFPVTFTWHAVNGICEGTDNVVVTFLKPPHTEAGPTQSICGTTTSLHADTIGSGIIWAQWISGLPGVVINQSGSIPANATVDASAVGNLYTNSAAPVYFYWVAQNGQGCSNIDSVLVTFYEIPDAFAGADDSICGKTYDLVGQFSIDNPSGNWQVYQKPYATSTANFLPASDPDGTVTVSDYGTYTFIWRESNAGNLTCLDRDSLTITFLTIPHPDAGLDFDVCGKYAELNAVPTPGTDGYWQSVLNAWYDPAVWPGDTVFCMPCMNDPNVIAYYSSENDSVTYYWMEFNGQCYGYDSVNVYFGSIQPAIHLVDPSDSLNCGRLTDLLAAQQPAYGNGYWYDNQSLTQYYPSAFNNNPDSTIISAASYGWHYFHWVTVNGDCRDTSDVVPIKFIRQPNAYAGSHYWPGLFGPNSQIKTDTVCALQYKLSAVPSYGNGQWFTLDPVNTWFSSVGKDPITGNAIPSPLATDSANINFYTVFNAPYYREFVWIEDNEGCVDKDTLRLYFAPRPSGTFTATTPYCRYTNSLIVANTWPLPNNINYGITYFGWDVGNGIIVDTTAMFQQDSILVHWNTGTSHTVTLITENKWGCRSTINIQQISEPPLFSPAYAINPATCGNANGELILSTSNNTYEFEWLDSAIANPLDTGQYGLIPGHDYQIVVTGQSLSQDAPPSTYCHDTISITMTNSGNITALFDTMFTQMLPVPFDQQLINLTSNGRRFSWRIFDQDGNLVGTTSTENPVWTFNDPGCYRLVLVAESKVDTSWFGIERFGCKDTFEYKWLCFDATPLLEIPNVFTPNGDGMNDIFLVHAKSIVEFNAVIYNRWGKKLYEWDDVYKGWDGKIGGADASPGVYYYIITAKGKDDTEFEYKGFFYLMREK